MKMSKPILLALTTASVFSAAVAIAQNDPQPQTGTSASAAASVKCYGINSCKGMSQCQTSTNSCSGKNACKGKGVAMVNNQQECITKGGSLTEPVAPATAAPVQPYGQ